MDEQLEQTIGREGGVTRRVFARSAAAGGLTALFAAVGAGRVLADDDDDENTDTADDTVDTVEDDDTADTVDTVETVDTVDTVDMADDESVAGPTGGARRSKGKKLHKGGKRGKGHH